MPTDCIENIDAQKMALPGGPIASIRI